jgi:4,5-dihydroxyphthalate decarboxylase
MADKPILKTLLGDYPNNTAIKSGAVSSPLVGFDFADVKVPNRAFKRVVRDLEFDFAELAIVTALQAYSYDKPLVLLPAVIGAGRYQHHCIVYNKARGHMEPSKLAGKRIGVRAHAQTTGAWIRGILAEEHGVDLDSITWVTFEDGHLAEWTDPPGIQRAPEGKVLMDMLKAGELDAIIAGNEAIADPDIVPLIPDAQVAAKAWSERHGALPINHIAVVRRSVIESNPGAIRAAWELLVRSKAIARKGAAATSGPDLTPFGIEANRAGVALITDYSYRQKLIPKRYEVDELFGEARRLLGEVVA